jgi:hypothetical protein
LQQGRLHASVGIRSWSGFDYVTGLSLPIRLRMVPEHLVAEIVHGRLVAVAPCDAITFDLSPLWADRGCKSHRAPGAGLLILAAVIVQRLEV